jgi:hypothetical protein
MSLGKISTTLLEFAPVTAPAPIPVGARPRRQHREDRRRAERDEKLRAEHRAARQALHTFIREGGIRSILTAPFIYSMLIPFAILDAWVWVYQAICFRAWRIAPVKRRSYFAYDHHKLAYLNAIEKLNCVYCTYGNGVIAYVREVAARTQQYWCPIRHARKIRDPHKHVAQFVPYGDVQAYKRELPVLRQEIR